MSSSIDAPAAPPSTSGTRPALAQTKESSMSPDVPRRAHTFQSGTLPEPASPFITVQDAQHPPDSPDATETTDNDDWDAGRASVDMGELPIELVSLTDRYDETG